MRKTKKSWSITVRRKHPEEEVVRFDSSEMDRFRSREWYLPSKRNNSEMTGVGFTNPKMKVPQSSGRPVMEKRKYPEKKVVEFDSSKIFHPSGIDTLLKDLKNLLTSGEDSDVTIKVKDREFRAHKNILRARSPVFYKMFSHDLYEKENGIIDITDCEPDAFQEFLNYLYSGEINYVPVNIVCSLYYIGDKYGVEEIKEICVISLSKHLSVETFCEIITLAQLYKDSTLLETASDFFVDNLKAIISTDKWLFFLREHPVTANELHIKAADH